MRKRRRPQAGDRFGDFEVIEVLPPRQVGKSTKGFLRVRCACGTERVVQTGNLTAGNSRSCGCKRDRWVEQHRKPTGMANARQAYNNYKGDARRRGMEFRLSFEEFYAISQLPCVYCGDELSNRAARHAMNGEFRYNGVDRVDSDRGYDPDNCVPCCRQCNYAKKDIPQDEFVAWAKRVAQHLEENNGESLHSRPLLGS